MKPVHAVLAMLLTACVPAAHAQDAFEAGQQAAQAKNPPGLTCTLSLPAGRTQFQQGELIFLTETFKSDWPGAYALAHDTIFSEMHPEALHVSPTEGTADPNAAVPTQTMFNYEGPPPPAPTPITGTPVSSKLLVNSSLRFDRPGTYRLYATTSQVVEGKAKNDGFIIGGKAFPVASNIVQFQIVPADPAWAQSQLKAALAETQEHYAGPMTVYAPWQVLCYLGTQDSARALLSIMAKDKAPRSSAERGYLCRPGLVGFPDQPWLIGEMKHDLTAPDYAVTEDFLETLADLATWQRTPKAHDNGRMLRTYWLRAADAAMAKDDAARPMTLATLLDEAWQSPALGEDPAVQARLPRLTHRLALDFDHLPPLPQEYLLGDQWPQFRSLALLPALKRLWKTAQVSDNNDIFQRGNTTLNGLILRRLKDLAPAQGRALTLSEIASPRPRADLDALGSLPDATLPSLDDTLASHLADRQDVDTTCQLIARYATDAILPQVKAFYAQPQDAETEPALLAYFLRVKPSYGTLMLHQALLRWLGRGTQETLIGDVALVQYGSPLEQVAMSGLNNPDPGVVADAARTLGHYGSPSTEAALWARLRRRDPKPHSRVVVEQGLIQALAAGQNWYESQAQVKQIRALCVTAQGRQQVDEFLQRSQPGAVHVDYELNSSWQSWCIGRYNSQGRAAFVSKLAQFPHGTVFSWQDISFGPDEDRLFKQAQRTAQAHGSSLNRWRPKAIL